MKVFTVRPYPDAPIEIFFSKKNAENYARQLEKEWNPLGIILHEIETKDEPCTKN